MPTRTADAAGLITGYVLGSVPTGVWLGRALRGVDVRQHGSGGTGTTNVLRTVGPAAAAGVFGLDVAKGAAAVLVARRLGCSSRGTAAAGVAAVVGHSWPVLADFRGGKGVATAFGALIVVSPAGAACAVPGGLGALAATRVVSIGSLAAASSAAAGSVVAAARGGPRSSAGMAFTLTAAAIVVGRHHANIRRILRGQEPKLRLSRG